MKKRLFLVRREGRRFVGPLTMTQFRDCLRQMTFGPQDEVSGHCGPWVEMEDVAIVARFYPEIANVLSEENEKNWKVSPNPLLEANAALKKTVITGDKAVNGKTSSRSKSSSSSDNRARARKVPLVAVKELEVSTPPAAWVFLAFSVVAFAVAIVVALKTWGVGRDSEDVAPYLVESQALLQRESTDEFVTYFAQHLTATTRYVQKNKDALPQWLPLFRAYVFLSAAPSDTLPLKILRGTQPVSAPIDCSIESWKKRLKDSAQPLTQALVSGKVAKNIVLKALTWDPYWIKRRRPAGWIKPSNYFAGCLLTLGQAVRQVSQEVPANEVFLPADQLSQLMRRLQLQLDVIKGAVPAAAESNAAAPFFAGMNCVDTADSVAALTRCRSQWNGIDASAASILETKFGWNTVRLAMNKAGRSAGEGAAVSVTDLQPWLEKLHLEEPFTKFDYSTEMRFLQLALLQGSVTPALIDKVESEVTEIKLR